MAHLMNQARQAMENLTNKRQQHQSFEASNEDIQAVQQCIQSAYEQCSPEEEQELKQLEQQLNQYQ